MVMTGSPFELAMEQYRKQSGQPSPVSQPQEEPAEVKYNNDSARIEFSPFSVAEQIYTGKQPEGFFEEALRDVTRTGSRMVETVL